MPVALNQRASRASSRCCTLVLDGKLLDFPAALPAPKHASDMSETWTLYVDGHLRKMLDWAYPFVLACWRQVKKDGVPFDLRVEHAEPLWLDVESNVDFLIPEGHESDFTETLNESEYEEFMEFFDSGKKHVYRLVDVESNDIYFPRAQDVKGR